MDKLLVGFLPSTKGFHFSNNDFPHIPCNIKILSKNLRIGDAANGLCGGMVYAVRDYFLAGVPVPSTATAPGTGPLFDYLCQRQVDSFYPPLGLLQYYYRMIPLCNPDINRLTCTAHLICRDIDDNLPSTLGLIRVKSFNPLSIIHNHQIIVYGYYRDREQVIFYVYDPNYPDNDNLRMHLVLAKQAPQIFLAVPDASPLPLFAFFRTRYSFCTPPRS